MIAAVTGIIGLLVAAFILLLMRKDRLHVSHGLGWFLVALCFALLGLAPGMVDWVASKIGVAYPPVLALTIGIALLVVKVLLMDIERSRIEVRNQRLVQRIALLEADMLALQQEATSSSTTQRSPPAEKSSGNQQQ